MESQDNYFDEVDRDNDLENVVRNQKGFYERYGVDASASNVAHMLTEEGTDPDFGKDLTEFYFLCQINPHGGTEISDWELRNIFTALKTKAETNRWLRGNFLKIQNIVSGEIGKFNSDPVLSSAIQKQGEYTFADGNTGICPDLSNEEMEPYYEYDRAFKVAAKRCTACGDTLGRNMDKWVSLSRKQAELRETMRNPGIDSDTLTVLDKKLLQVSENLEAISTNIKLLSLGMHSDKRDEESGEWARLSDAAEGIAQTMAVCRQWLTNQSDLDPISKLWIYQGRTAEFHPNNMEAMAKELPAFNDAFRGMLALGSWKYALGSDGKIYPSGKNGLGFVDRNGEIIDVDQAVNRDRSGKITGLRAGVTHLRENQIWLSGRAVDVIDGKVTIGTREVRIFSKNILRDNGEALKDKDVKEYLKTMFEFTRGRDLNSSDHEIELAVEMAREFFEFSMLANWNGVARDSERRPYYMMGDDWSTLTSDPERSAVKQGNLIKGALKEATTFPYWTGGDWGKLTLTRQKQFDELSKGRKRALYALVPFLPENLVQPLLNKETVDDVLQGMVRMEDIFGEMSSVEHFKTYWLNIFKAISVYEFISSSFVGDKDVTKADQDLIAFLMQTRVLEGINKDIDLSLAFSDKTEAARLKVNIVLAALATVSKDFIYEDFMGVVTGSTSSGRTKEMISDINPKAVERDTKQIDIYVALRQLVDSTIIGGDDELKIILKRLKSYKNGESALGFSLAEFKSVFGNESAVLARTSKAREERRQTVLARQEKDGKKKL